VHFRSPIAFSQSRRKPCNLRDLYTNTQSRSTILYDRKILIKNPALVTVSGGTADEFVGTARQNPVEIVFNGAA